MKIKYLSFTISLIAASTLSIPSFAQTENAPQRASRATIEEVVITSRKKEESLQDAPLAVTAFSSDELDIRAAVGISDITAGIPNVSFESSGSTSGLSAAPAVFIRGLGQADFVINADPGVGSYVDGVYVGRTMGSLSDLLDLERVEVLRGPQGTLFGRNTIGGAVSLVSKAPSTDELYGKLQVSAGELGYTHISGSVNIPLSDIAAARISGFGRHRDGHVEALQYDDFQLGEQNVAGLRAALRVDVSDSFTVDFAADYSERNDSPAAQIPRLIGNASIGGESIDASGIPVASRFNQGTPFPPPIPAGFGNTSGTDCSTAAARNASTDCFGNAYLGNGYESNQLFVNNDGEAFEPEQTLDVYGANLTLSWETAIGEIKSISAVRGFDSEFVNDIDYTPFVLFHNNHDEYTQDQFSQELQLVGTTDSGALDYVFGLYYFEEDGTEAVALLAPLLPPANSEPNLPYYQVTDRIIDNDSIAAYGQMTWHATDKLDATLGLRYTEENKDIFFEQRFESARPSVSASGQQSTEEVTPMLNVSYNATDDTLLYVNYSEGFRSGGFASRFANGLISPLPFYNPEYVDSYEVGLKSDLLDNRVRVNLALFMTDYTDLQVTATSPALGGGVITQNLADATLQGIELEIDAAVTENLRLDFSVGYLDAEIDSVLGGVLNAGGANQQYTIDSDSQLPYTPEYSVNLGLTHYMPISTGEIRSRVDWFYKSEQEFSIENHPLARQGSYSRVNANVSYTPHDANYSIALGGRNLTDEEYATAAAINTTASTVGTNVARPREIYVQATYNF